MNACFQHIRGWTCLAVVGAGLAWGGAPTAWAQEKLPSKLKDQLLRTGVYFRADAPWALRNREDPYLPIYLEIINGVEKEAHTTGSSAAEYVAREPLKLEGVNVFVKPAGSSRQFVSEPLLVGVSQEFSYDARTNGSPFAIAGRLNKTLQVPRELMEAYLNRHFLGAPFGSLDLRVSFQVIGWPAQDFYLRVRPNAPPLPRLPGWYRGDMHYHSGFTDNPAERGYPLDVTKQAALHAGLDWLLLSDHSTDLSAERFAQELLAARKYSDQRFVLIRGEELTLTSGKLQPLTTVHMVALPSPDDPDKGFPDPANPEDCVILTGDGSLVSPALPLKDALARINSAGGFAYAAHPFDPISPLLRGGSWDLNLDFLAPGGKSLPPGLVGMEPWNRATAATADDARDPYCLHRDANPAACFQPDQEANQYERLEKAIELGWRPLLLKGLQAGDSSAAAPGFKVFLAAGSDAHGDFNYEATMDVVDFLRHPSRGVSGYAEDNALGKISSVVYAPAGMGPRGENILRALREGRSVLSNGPLLVAGFDRNANGSLGDPQDVGPGQEISCPLTALPPLQLSWVSSQEFGPLESVHLIVGSSSGESPPEEIPVPPSKALASDALFPFDLRHALEKNLDGWCYVRLEARTRNSAREEFRCYTNPIWVRVTRE